MLHFTLVRSRLEYASVVWNSITSTDANKLECIQQNFASSLSIAFIFLHVPHSYTFAFEKLSLVYPLLKRRHHIDVLFLFMFIVALDPALPSRKMLVFVCLVAVLGTSKGLVFVPLTNTVLLDGPMLPTWWVKMSTYLQSERFISIILHNFLSKIVNNFFS
jgi:hypothetical protein